MLKNRDRVIVLFFFTSKCDERLERKAFWATKCKSPQCDWPD